MLKLVFCPCFIEWQTGFVPFENGKSYILLKDIYEKYIEKREQAYLKGNCLNNSSINRKIKLEQFSIALSELRSLLNEVEHISEIIWQQKQFLPENFFFRQDKHFMRFNNIMKLYPRN